MLCSKCYKKISPSEEVQIEGSIICKECVLAVKKTKKKEIIARCHTCYWEIYKGDLIHEDSWSINVGVFVFLAVNVIKHKKLIQCQWCYQQWLNEKKQADKVWKKYKAIVWVNAVLLLGTGIFLFFWKSRYISLLAFIPLIVLVVIPISHSFFVEAKRYKFRKRKKSEKLKTAK